MKYWLPLPLKASGNANCCSLSISCYLIQHSILQLIRGSKPWAQGPPNGPTKFEE